MAKNSSALTERQCCDLFKGQETGEEGRRWPLIISELDAVRKVAKLLRTNVLLFVVRSSYIIGRMPGWRRSAAAGM